MSDFLYKSYARHPRFYSFRALGFLQFSLEHSLEKLFFYGSNCKIPGHFEDIPLQQRLRGFTARWLRGYRATWLHGDRAMGLCFYVATQLTLTPTHSPTLNLNPNVTQTQTPGVRGFVATRGVIALKWLGILCSPVATVIGDGYIFKMVWHSAVKPFHVSLMSVLHLYD